MLTAFGYSFTCETPPIFRHEQIEDVDLDMKEDATQRLQFML